MARADPRPAAPRPVRLPALVDLAAGRHLTEDERAALLRPRADDVEQVEWTHDDVPLLDEARALLGPAAGARLNGSEAEEIRTYGHIVVDEAQDLSPMQLRMLDRRSLNGSMTVVGDIAQATGRVGAPGLGRDPRSTCPRSGPAERAELSIGYRIPGPTMDLAAKVLAVAEPDLQPPEVGPPGGRRPPGAAGRGRRPGRPGGGGGGRGARRGRSGQRGRDRPGHALVDEVAAALDRAGVEFGRAARNGLESRVTLVPVSLVKGLELDAAVVVEPAAIVDEESQGMRAPVRGPDPGHQAPGHRPRPRPPRPLR